MLEVTAETAADYLRQTGRVPENTAVKTESLGWGVSNIVLRVDVEGQAPMVLKQSRERLRTKALWVSRLDRIWTECAALELLDTILPSGTVPRVLFKDPDNFLFAMTCAPSDSVVWKEQLLAGKTDPAVARRAGEILGTMHASTVDHPALQGLLADTTVFDQLRVDPFYRTIARVHPDLQETIEALIESMSALPPEQRCFVHADFSPKNILVHDQGLTLVDFETSHRGDPAYDVGFFLSHLFLKGVRAGSRFNEYLALSDAFMETYLPITGKANDHEFGRHVRLHHMACALARIDGTSPVDYLDETMRASLRERLRAALLRGKSPERESPLGRSNGAPHH